MSSNENIKSEWPRIDKGYRSFYGTSAHYEMGDVVIIDPNKPNVWFFGDSFVEFPKDNVWKPITDKCNLVHHGRGGTGLESVFMQLLACRRWIQSHDRVIISLSHHTRDMGVGGSRWQYQNGEPRIYNDFHDPQRTPEESKRLTDIYVNYNKEVRWPESSLMRFYGYKKLIYTMDFKTPYITIFEAFETMHYSNRKALNDYWLEDDEVDNLLHMTGQQKEMPFWNFIHKMAGLDIDDPASLGNSFIVKRMGTKNHFEDQDVHKFWNYYIHRLNKLGLDNI